MRKKVLTAVWLLPNSLNAWLFSELDVTFHVNWSVRKMQKVLPEMESFFFVSLEMVYLLLFTHLLKNLEFNAAFSHPGSITSMEKIPTSCPGPCFKKVQVSAFVTITFKNSLTWSQTLEKCWNCTKADICSDNIQPNNFFLINIFYHQSHDPAREKFT